MSLVNNFSWEPRGTRRLNAENARRVSWSAALVLLVLAAGVVMYDAIPGAKVTTDIQNILAVQHDRFGVVGQLQNILLRVTRAQGEPVSIQLDEAFRDRFDLEHTIPTANTVSSADGVTTLTFDTPANSGVFDVALLVKPTTWGRQELPLRISVAQKVSVQANLTEYVAP